MAVSSTFLKGLCHEETAVLGQFCGEVIVWSLFPTKKCSVRDKIVWVIFAGKALKPEKLGQFFQVSIYIHPCHPKQQTTENSFNT